MNNDNETCKLCQKKKNEATCCQIQFLIGFIFIFFSGISVLIVIMAHKEVLSFIPFIFGLVGLGILINSCHKPPRDNYVFIND